MPDQSRLNSTVPANSDLCGDDSGPFPGEGTSRRAFLKSSAGLLAGGAAGEMLPAPALAQGVGAATSDPELARVQGQRRILLKGGIVLTLDRQVGGFAQADVLIEDGKI